MRADDIRPYTDKPVRGPPPVGGFLGSGAMFHVKHWPRGPLQGGGGILPLGGRLEPGRAEMGRVTACLCMNCPQKGRTLSLLGQAYTRINPLPKISLELVTRMKAWGSADFRYSRRATAWDRDRAVSTTHLGSWV